MTKKLYLHVGPHKTGSTYLQRMFSENRLALAESGITYPEVFGNLLGHHELYEYLSAETIGREFKTKICQLAELESDVILSSENFSKLGRADFQKLQADLPDFEFEVIFFVRSFSSKMLSWWHELIKHGATQDFFSYAYPNMAAPFNNKELYPGHSLKNLQDAFGSTHLKLLHYEGAVARQSMLGDFFAAVGRSSPVPDQVRHINAMMVPAEIELVRYLNQYAKQRNLLRAHNVRVSFLEKKKELPDEIGALIQGMERYNEPVPNQCLAIDLLVSSRLMQDYAQCFANEPTDIALKTAMIPNSNWLMDRTLRKQANALFSKLKDTL